MFFAAQDNSLWMPAALIIVAAVTCAKDIWKTMYEKKAKGGNASQSPTPNPQKKPSRLSLESITMTLLFLVSVWQLVVTVSEPSPVTRIAAFKIACFTGVAFIGVVYWLIRLVLYLVTVRFRRERK